MTRVYGLHPNPNHHYPSYAPKVLWHRLKHWLFGPLLGCSCSGPGRGPNGRRLGRPALLAAPDGSCFRSRWRIYWWREASDDRLRARARLDVLEQRLEKLERRERARRERERSGVRVTGVRQTPGWGGG